jgi:hypothetical protein
MPSRSHRQGAGAEAEPTRFTPFGHADSTPKTALKKRRFFTALPFKKRF